MEMQSFLKAYPIYEEISQINGEMAALGAEKRKATIALTEIEKKFEDLRQRHADALTRFKEI